MGLRPPRHVARIGSGDRVEARFEHDLFDTRHDRRVEAANRGASMPHGRLRIEAENKRVIAIAANDRVDAADAVVSTLRDGVITVSEVEGAYARSEEHTSELQSLMRSPSAVSGLKKKHKKHNLDTTNNI